MITLPSSPDDGPLLGGGARPTMRVSQQNKQRAPLTMTMPVTMKGLAAFMGVFA
jgi:hypothetical protein